MDIKQVEIRDSMTFIPALAIRFSGEEGYLFRRAGFVREHFCVALIRLSDFETHYDPFEWKRVQGRSMHVAHRYLIEHWHECSGDDILIDVEFVLGETNEPKKSERGVE